MGLIRNLTSAEIIGQVVRGLQVSIRENMPPMTNIVLMVLSLSIILLL